MIEMEYKWKIQDLVESSGLTRRQIHELTHRRVIRPPVGKARGARYSDDQMQTLKKVAQLKELGLSLASIKDKIEAVYKQKAYKQKRGNLLGLGEWLAFELDPGIILVVDSKIEECCSKEGVERYVESLKGGNLLRAFGYHLYIEKKSEMLGGEQST